MLPIFFYGYKDFLKLHKLTELVWRALLGNLKFLFRDVFLKVEAVEEMTRATL